MSCHGCAKSFGLLNKEVGCPKCKFSYCKGCLKFKMNDINTGKEIIVCRQCTQARESQQRYSKSNLLQKLESLEAPKPPITVYREAPRDALKRGLSKEDEQILKRLENLRDSVPGRRRSSNENPDELLAKRLARLKGEPEEKAQNNSDLLSSKPAETDAELITRLANEVTLDEAYKKNLTSDIESRLANLRGSKDTTALSNTTKSNQPFGEEMEMTEEEQVKMIISRYVEEVKLEKENPPSDMDVVDISSEEDDIPMERACRICEEKLATFKCDECDGDKFCKLCFQEFHNELGERHEPTLI